MSISLKPEYLKRYLDITRLILKYGRSSIVLPDDIEGADLQDAAVEPANGRDPEQLARDLEALGPTYVKVGQFLSTRPDLVSPVYIPALARLRDRVEPIPVDEVESIINDELGVRVNKAFAEFNPVPVAAASLSQVHRARLRDGREVAVKVQRPGVRQTVFEDLAAFGDIAEFLQKHSELGSRFAIQNVLESFRRSLMLELDFKREGQNLKRLGEILKSYDEIIVPQPIDDYTTSRILTMDFIEGSHLNSVNPVVLLNYDRPRLAEALGKAYLDQILVHGFIHADPHPGNILLTVDGRLALVDLGMVTLISPTRQDQLLKLLLATSEGKADQVARVMMEIGTPLEGHDEASFTDQITGVVLLNRDASVQDIRFGRVVIELIRIAAENGIRPAPELSMMGKALLNLDETSRMIDPDVNPNALIRQYIQTLVSKQVGRMFSPATLLSSALELYEFVERLPGRMNLLLDRLASEKFEIRVRAFDETAFLKNLQKIANRITSGLVLAALIVGAALMMQVQTPFRLFGYPGFAMIMFLLAALLGLMLVGRIFFDDSRGH